MIFGVDESKIVVCLQDEPAVAPHFVCLHVSAPDRLQHEETHVQDALQGGRPGRTDDLMSDLFYEKIKSTL